MAPWSEDDHQDVVRKLHEQFNVELASRGLGKLIHSMLLTREDPVLNAHDAERVLRERNARLVVFGRVTRGGIKGAKAEGFSEISFQIRQNVVSQDDARMLLSAFTIDDFAVKEENSFFKARFAADNLGNCACMFIGMSLTAERRYDEARELWKNLFEKTRPKAAPVNEKQLRFSFLVARWYQRNEFFWLIEYYNQHLLSKITSRSADPIAKVCQDRLQFLLQLNPKFHEYLHFQAILQFHRGEVKEALRTIEYIETLLPNGLPPLFSRAFLTLWQRKFKPALRCFKRMMANTNPPAPFILSVVTFYESLILQYPDRHELSFGSAFVNELFCDRKVAEENYEVFLSAANGSLTYSPLTEFASTRLALLRQNPTGGEPAVEGLAE